VSAGSNPAGGTKPSLDDDDDDVTKLVVNQEL